MVIYYRTLLDDLRRHDSLYCSACVSRLRRKFQEAAERGKINFLRCHNCGGRWAPSGGVDIAIAGWLLVFLPDDPIPSAVLCAVCSIHPDPLSLPSIAERVLRHSRGPLQ
jgi:hypothetical protein